MSRRPLLWPFARSRHEAHTGRARERAFDRHRYPEPLNTRTAKSTAGFACAAIITSVDLTIRILAPSKFERSNRIGGCSFQMCRNFSAMNARRANQVRPPQRLADSPARDRWLDYSPPGDGVVNRWRHRDEEPMEAARAAGAKSTRPPLVGKLQNSFSQLPQAGLHKGTFLTSQERGHF